MIDENLSRGVRVIVVANEKGGSGKSTVAIHIAVALLRAGQGVATIDLDLRQRSFTQYIDNRLAWARQRGIELPSPTHVCFDEEDEFSSPGSETEGRKALAETINATDTSLSVEPRNTKGSTENVPLPCISRFATNAGEPSRSEQVQAPSSRSRRSSRS